MAKTIAKAKWKRGGLVLNQVQLEVLKHMAHGMTNRQIASVMCYSQQSVKRHVSAIMRKMNARSRAHAVAMAVRRGLIDTADRSDISDDWDLRGIEKMRVKGPMSVELYDELKREIDLLAEQVAVLTNLINAHREMLS